MFLTKLIAVKEVLVELRREQGRANVPGGRRRHGVLPRGRACQKIILSTFPILMNLAPE